MSSEKKTKITKNKSDENSPVDSEYSTRVANESNDYFLTSNMPPTSTVTYNPNATMPNDYDEDDEEDFISKYFIKTTKSITNMYKCYNCLNI